VYPEAYAMETENEQHIVTCIGDRFYDVDGEFLGCVKSITPEKEIYRTSVHRGQRVEYMLMKKY